MVRWYYMRCKSGNKSFTSSRNNVVMKEPVMTQTIVEYFASNKGKHGVIVTHPPIKPISISRSNIKFFRDGAISISMIFSLLV